jgi:hypothetical protein
MRKTTSSLSDDLRAAIDRSPLSRYRICKEVGLDQACMTRFMARRVGLQTKNSDAIGRLLGLRIVQGDSSSEREDNNG